VLLCTGALHCFTMPLAALLGRSSSTRLSTNSLCYNRLVICIKAVSHRPIERKLFSQPWIRIIWIRISVCSSVYIVMRKVRTILAVQNSSVVSAFFKEIFVFCESRHCMVNMKTRTNSCYSVLCNTKTQLHRKTTK